uniref:PX domain-containing protein n=1 Tax=Trichuris muris TaxID=70415 RepID=A0A5S6Q777_TRIMR
MIAQCVVAVLLLNAFVVVAKQDLTLCILCFWFLVLGYVLLLPFLCFVDTQREKHHKEATSGDHFGKLPPFDFRSKGVPVRVPGSIDGALQSLLNLCVEKFFDSWHDKQCDCTAVADEIRRLIRRIVVVLYWRLKACDLRSLVFDRLCPLLVVHLGRFASQRSSDPGQQPLETERRIIETLGSRLHPAVSSREDELRYLRSVASLLAKVCLGEIDEWSDSATRFLRELIAFGLLLPVMDSAANTNCVNRLLCGLLTPDVDYGPTECSNVELLDGFCHSRPDGLLPSLTLEQILADQPSFFAFMTYLKAERAPLVFVQFLLSARQILDKLNGELAGSGVNMEDVSHVHWEAWELYRNYLHADLGESFVSCLSSGLVEAIKAAIEVDTQTFPTKILRPLCSAYHHVYTMLQDNYVGPFCSSLYFYDLLFGEVQFESGANEDRLIGNTSGASIIPADDMESVNAEMMTASRYSSASRSDSSEASLIGSEDDIYDLDDTVLSPRDMSTWKVCVPRVEPRRDQQTGRTTYVYVVEICRTLAESVEEGEGCYMLQWNVDRRYHEFYVLEAKLIEFHGEDILKGFPLPPKKSLRTKPRAFVVSYRPTFDQFVKRLLANPMLKNSELLFTFLTAREELSLGLLPDPIKAMRRVPVRLQRERGQNLASFMQTLVLSCTFDSVRHSAAIRSKGSVDAIQSDKAQIHRLQRSQTVDSIVGNNFGVASNGSGGGDCGTLTDCRVPFRRSFDLLLYLLSKVFCMNCLLCSLCCMVGHTCASLFDALFRRWCQRKLDSWLHAKQVAQCIGIIKEIISVSADSVDPMNTEADVQLAEYTRLRIHQFAGSEYGFLRLLLSPAHFSQGIDTLHDCLQCPRLNKYLSYMLLDSALSFFFSDLAVELI